MNRRSFLSLAAAAAACLVTPRMALTAIAGEDVVGANARRHGLRILETEEFAVGLVGTYEALQRARDFKKRMWRDAELRLNEMLERTERPWS